MARVDPETGELLPEEGEEETLKQQMNLLTDMQAQLDLLMIEKNKLIDSILTPEMREQIEDIEYEFAENTKTVRERIGWLEQSIKQRCLNLGKTVKTDHVTVVWSKGRAGGWDTKALEGYIAAGHPELNQFKKPDGDPTASIRRSK